MGKDRFRSLKTSNPGFPHTPVYMDIGARGLYICIPAYVRRGTTILYNTDCCIIAICMYKDINSNRYGTNEGPHTHLRGTEALQTRIAQRTIYLRESLYFILPLNRCSIGGIFLIRVQRILDFLHHHVFTQHTLFVLG
jgi:hypothetical protein